VIIDSHVHLSFDNGDLQWFPFTRNRSDYVAYLRSLGIDRFLVFPGGEDVVETNRSMLRFWRRNPSLVIPAVKLDPVRPALSLAEMERARENGIVVAGEFLTYEGRYEYRDRGFVQIVEKANELGMILVVHLEPEEEKPFERMLSRFPDTSFVIPHLWGGGDIVRDKVSMIRRHPNAYVDLSGTGVDRLGLWEYAIQTVGADRVLWGSDYPINDPAVYLARLASLRMPAGVKKRISGANIERLIARHGGAL